MIDSHCHLTSKELLPQIGAVLVRAEAAGVKEFVTIATDLADAAAALALAETHPQVHVVCGVHPHQAGETGADWHRKLADLVKREEIYAVGEMGLDYHYDFADRKVQRQVFERQIEIAGAAKKPIVIHCREAHADVLAVLAHCGPARDVVFHCFTGTLREAEEILDRGYWISLTGVVTFKRSDELRQVAKLIPEERLMIETDSPYLSPEPVRNVRPNEPSHLRYTAACIAQTRGLTVEALAHLTTANTRRFFNLPERT